MPEEESWYTLLINLKEAKDEIKYSKGSCIQMKADTTKGIANGLVNEQHKAGTSQV